MMLGCVRGHSQILKFLINAGKCLGGGSFMEVLKSRQEPQRREGFVGEQKNNDLEETTRRMCL